jgi:hypothetical protein
VIVTIPPRSKPGDCTIKIVNLTSGNVISSERVKIRRKDSIGCSVDAAGVVVTAVLVYLTVETGSYSGIMADV